MAGWRCVRGRLLGRPARRGIGKRVSSPDKADAMFGDVQVINDFRRSQIAVAQGSGGEAAAAAANVGRKFRINQLLNSSTGGAKYVSPMPTLS